MNKKFTFFAPALLVLLELAGHSAIAQNVAPYWSLGGNSNSAAASKLGTTNAINLRIVTGNVERMRVTTTGLVGIGTTTPSQRLHVVGNEVITGNLGLGVNTPAYKLHVVGSGYITDGLIVGGTGVSSNATSYGLVGYGGYAGAYGSGASYGTYGYSTGGIGAFGYSGKSYGVYGNSEAAAAVYGSSSGQVGVLGKSVNQVGVYGTSTNYHGGYFYSTKGYGMWAKTGATGAGAYAGVFEGTVYTFGVYTTSDQNLKKNIEKFDHAMDILSQLNPSYYEFKNEGKYASLHLPKGKHYGLLAQEVEKVLPDLVDASIHEEGETKEPSQIEVAPLTGDGKNAPSVNGKLPEPFTAAKRETFSVKAVNYIELIPIMIKALQEQQATIEELKEKINTLSRMAERTKLTGAYLEQNTPNPVKGSSTIRYSLPATVRNANIAFVNMKGQLIRTLSLGNLGEGQVTFNRGALPAGTYTYTLYADGERVESKKMILP